MISTAPAGRGRRVMQLARRAEIVALSLVILICCGIAWGGPSVFAAPNGAAGQPVPAGDVDAIVSAALSCPALTPPRLAAQIMAASSFDASADSTGVAGLDAKRWGEWKPSSTAQPGDRAASIMALAHSTCDLVGRLRAARMTTDLWPAAVAALHSGAGKVVAARGIPSDSKDYVDHVSALAEFYASQSPFKVGAPAPAPTAPSGDTDIPVPADYVSTVQAAGRICPTITAPRIAAQLRAASGFDANMRTDHGQGIAQFSPELWARYEPNDRASVWNPTDSIIAMGFAMCDLVNQFAGLSGSDPYTSALGAFQWGPTAIRQANGLPRANVPQLSQAVAKFEPEYNRDARLTAKTAPRTMPPTSPTPSRSSPATLTSKLPPPAPGPARVKFYTSGNYYNLVNPWAQGAVLEMAGDDVNKNTDAQPQLSKNMHDFEKEKDQYWKLTDAPDAGCVIITNAFSGLSLGIRGSSKDNGAKVVQLTSNPSDHSQQWYFRNAGKGRVHIYNRNSGKVLDLLGDDFGPPEKDGTWNGFHIEQYDLQEQSSDQQWVLAPR